MEKTIRYVLPHELLNQLKHICINDQQFYTGFTLLGLISIGQRRTLEWIVKYHNECHRRHKCTRKSVRHILDKLKLHGMIFKAEKERKVSRNPPLYKLTPHSVSLIRPDERYYEKPFFFQANHVVDQDELFASDVSINTGKSDKSPIFSGDAWRSVLPTNFETECFIYSLRELEMRPLIVNRIDMYNSIHSEGIYKLGSLPINPFYTAYLPEVNNRVNSSPYIFKGDLMRFIRPQHDPWLTKGQLFYLDYVNTEPRLLAHFSQYHAFIDFVRTHEDIYSGIFDSILPIESIPRSMQKLMVLTYLNSGSAKGLVKTDIFKEQDAVSLIEGQRIYELFKVRMLERFGELHHWINDKREECRLTGRFRVPGGIIQEVNPKLLNENGEAPWFYLQYGVAAALLQNATGYLTRSVITKAPDLEHAQLIIPIHDGFMFWAPNKHVEEAIHEASELMLNVGRGCAPEAYLEPKLKWQTGLHIESIPIDSHQILVA